MKNETDIESRQQRGVRVAAPSGMPTRALVVGDEEAMCALIRETLGAANIDAVSLTTSTEASGRFQDRKYDVILVDLCVPPVDAFELVREIRLSGFNRSTPVIMISDDLRPAALSEGFKAGASFFVYKPIDRAHLMRLILVTQGTIDQEKRRFRRIGVRAKVQVRCGNRSEEGETVDVSLNGALVRVPHAFPVGSSVEVSLYLHAGMPPLVGLGSVMRLCDGGQMGIQIDRMPPAETGRLQEFLLPFTSG